MEITKGTILLFRLAVVMVMEETMRGTHQRNDHQERQGYNSYSISF